MARLITIKVQTRSKNPGVDKIDSLTFRVRVKAAPEKGRANREVLERLAAELGLPPSHLKIVRGETAATKLIEIADPAHKPGR